MDRLGVWADRRIGEKAATPTPVPPKPTCSPSAGAIADLPFRRSVHAPRRPTLHCRFPYFGQPAPHGLAPRAEFLRHIGSSVEQTLSSRVDFAQGLVWRFLIRECFTHILEKQRRELIIVAF